MKMLVVPFLSIGLAFSLAACSESTSSFPDESQEESQKEVVDQEYVASIKEFIAEDLDTLEEILNENSSFPQGDEYYIKSFPA